jgi:SAM-dependent methyltransferase
VLALSACPICGEAERTPVCEYNGLVLLDAMREVEVSRYDYALCSGCGLVYATRRPAGAEYATLLRDFDENLGRPQPPAAFQPPAPGPEREDLLAALRDGPQRERPERAGSDPTWLPWADRASAEPHLEFLERSLDLSGARVLELRSKSGWLLDALRRRHGAEVYALPAFDVHGEAIRELFGIPAQGKLDFERLEVPYEGDFDLIVAKHMFTHALAPDELLHTLRSRLRRGGHLYLYLENDDARMQERRRNLFGEMKCFHFQNFDGPTLERCLAHQGIRALSIRHPSKKSALAVLARADEQIEAVPIPRAELEKRLERYRQWRDLSILSLPEAVQALFRTELPALRQRAVRRGDARRRLWRITPVRPLKLVHAAGYAALNRGTYEPGTAAKAPRRSSRS